MTLQQHADNLERRIIDISYKMGLAHISSCLNSVGIIQNIYEIKKKKDIFVLSNSHSALALYVVLEYNGIGNAEELRKRHGLHANRNLDDGIYVSGGSLGQAFSIAVGMAMADKNRRVYCLTGDGEWAEGVCWEALEIAVQNNLYNLIIYCCANGYSALGNVEVNRLEKKINSFLKDYSPKIIFVRKVIREPSFLSGVNGHYQVLDKEKYEQTITTIEKNGRISELLSVQEEDIS